MLTCVSTPKLQRACLVQSFEGREERDSATAVPDAYEPPNFHTVALQHTNVQLTWDADDDGRKRALSAKRATQADIREDDFKVHTDDTSRCTGVSWREGGLAGLSQEQPFVHALTSARTTSTLWTDVWLRLCVRHEDWPRLARPSPLRSMTTCQLGCLYVGVLGVQQWGELRGCRRGCRGEAEAFACPAARRRRQQCCHRWQ